MSSNLIEPLLQRSEAAIMGIVNVTPDSFSDGGDYFNAESAIAHGLQLVDEGADILDIGGESTRPGAQSVSLQQELDRVIPVIEQLATQVGVPISIDTYKPEVMIAAVEAGASMINDINGLRADNAVSVIADLNVPVCLMHMQGTPNNMQHAPEYSDVVQEVTDFLHHRIEDCLDAGIQQNNIIVDPGIGFGKSLEHNLALLRKVRDIREQLACEVLIGVSRKSMIDHLLGREVTQRLAASIALAVQAVLNGAKIVRVHDVQATYDAVRSIEAVDKADHT